MIATALVSAIGGLIGTWLETRKEKAKGKLEIEKAKTEATIKRIQTAEEADREWDRLMAEGSQTSWKDEFWTIMLSIPIVMLFWPDPEINQIAEDGFKRMENAPDWYVVGVMMAIAAAFGYRKFVKPWLDQKSK